MSSSTNQNTAAAANAVAVGDVVAERTVHLTRESLVRYAGASGDFNPIHYRDDVAERVGLPGVLGYLTIGVELVITAALLLGVYARWVGLIGVPLLLGTIVTVHGANGFGFANAGGGWEYPAFWALAAAFAICLL